MNSDSNDYLILCDNQWINVKAYEKADSYLINLFYFLQYLAEMRSTPYRSEGLYELGRG